MVSSLGLCNGEGGGDRAWEEGEGRVMAYPTL